MNPLKHAIERSALVALLFLLLAGLSSGALQAQTLAKATLNDGIVTLDEQAPLAFRYLLDIKDLNLETEDEVVNFFTSHNTQLVTFLVDYTRKAVEVHIECRMQPDWTTENWNAYLHDLMKE